MNSKTDKKQILSYFCILFLLCGVRTIGGIYCEETRADGVRPYDLKAEKNYPDAQRYLTDGFLVDNGEAARHPVYSSQYRGAATAPVSVNETIYYGFGSISLESFIIPVIFTILAARHMLC